MRQLESYKAWLKQEAPVRWSGHVLKVTGNTLESQGPPCSVGECCEIVDSTGNRRAAEVIGFRESAVLTMPLDDVQGIRFGDRVVSMGDAAKVGGGEQWLGRVVDACGQPLDGSAAPPITEWLSLQNRPPAPLERALVREPLGTGIRSIDGMLTTGRGQRVGIFGGSGVGKSTLIGMMTRNTEADVIVVGLIGERGREVQEFLAESLGETGIQRSITVVSTSDESPLMRMRGALTATAYAEMFARKGLHVLLVLDSLTRYAMAAREVGLAAGEPPVRQGYTPSVFSRLAQLVERAGNFQKGSITAFYTVLMEGDDQQDPIVDSVRSLLDGHVVLSRQMASEGVYPPIDLLDSLSRLMPSIVSPQQWKRAAEIRQLLGAYAHSADMIRIGAYKPGTDPDLDASVRYRPLLSSFFQQTPKELPSLSETVDQMLSLELQR